MHRTKNHDFGNRNSIRVNVLPAAVGRFSLKFIFASLVLVALQAQASKLPDFRHIGQTKTGNSISLGPTGNVGPAAPAFDSRIPIRQTNLGGDWQPAGNYGAAKSATVPANAQLLGSGEVIFPGTKYPFQAGYVVPPSLIVSALSALCSNPIVCVGLTVGTPYLLEWLNKGGVRINPQTGATEAKDPGVCTVAPCKEFQGGGPSYIWYGDACRAAADVSSSISDEYYTWSVESCSSQSVSWVAKRIRDGVTQSGLQQTLSSRSGQPIESSWQPASMSDISPYMDKPMDPRIFKELLDKGANIELPTPTITGPSSTTGDEVTTINSDGTKTVSKTSYNFQTSGNTITNTSSSTVTTNYNIDNSVKSTSSTSTVPSKPEDEKKDECKEYPDRAGCADLDTPEGEIPKDTKTITYSEESVFGGGSCPANLTASLGTLGKTVTVWDWQKTCEMALPLRALVLALASFAAFLIVMPGENRT